MQKAAKSLAAFDEELIPADLRPLLADSPKKEIILREILQLGQEAVTIWDSRELAQHVITTVNRITGAERGAIFLWNKNQNPPRLELRASKGHWTMQAPH